MFPWQFTPSFAVCVQSLSCVRFFVTPWTAAYQASRSFTISRSLLKLMSIEPVMPFNHITLCCPLLLLPSIFPCISDFSNESTLHQGTKILELQHQSFQWIFRADFLYDWPVVAPCSPRDSQESSPMLQLKSINFQCSAFFTFQFSHPYLTTGKTMA